MIDGNDQVLGSLPLACLYLTKRLGRLMFLGAPLHMLLNVDEADTVGALAADLTPVLFCMLRCSEIPPS